MRLKKIRLAGFKSFVDPTNIPFPDDMTAIVGPNGCGKSNVIDAVRWVLGESSAKNLRGDAMTDVIFNGSSVRKPVSQCSVELVFDNCDGRVQGEFAGYNELSVKRLVTREAQSHYFLNNTKCRRRDVTDVFLGTGLGPRSYAIIEQGMISRLIESKPQELRVFIEEAAGVSKYKERRRETETRIKHTRENLDRLQDVRSELGQQLDKLQRQAAAARRYTALKADERRLKAELAAIRWLALSAAVESLETEISTRETAISALVTEQKGDESSVITLLEARADTKQQATDTHNKNFRLATEITRLEQNQIHAEQQQQQLSRDLQRTRELLAECQSQQQTLTVERQTRMAVVEEKAPQLADLEQRQTQVTQLLASNEEELRAKQAEWRRQESLLGELEQKLQTCHSQMQAGLQMQLRTEQRIAELQDERELLERDELAEELQMLQETLADLVAQQQQLATDLIGEQATLELAKTTRDRAKSEHLQQQQQLHGLTAKLQSLQQVHAQANQLDAAVTEWLAEHAPESVSIAEYLQVEPPWQTAFETVLQQWHRAVVCPRETASCEINGARLFFEDEFTFEKRDGSLAVHCRAERVPHWLNSITVFDDDLLSPLQGELAAVRSGITRAGVWRGPDWLINGADADRSGTLARLASIAQLQQQLQSMTTAAEAMAERDASAEREYQSLAAALDSSRERHKALQLEIQQYQRQLTFTQQQQEKARQKSARLERDIGLQQRQLEDDKAQLEELNERVAMLQDELAEIEDESGANDREYFEAQRRASQARLDSLRATQTELQTQVHQLQLRLQSERSQVTNCDQRLTTLAVQISQHQQQLTELAAALEALAAPAEEQADHLAELLLQRTALEDSQRELNKILADIETQLSDREKGRQGMQSRIDQAKEAQQTARIECEGYKARANTLLEQLADTRQDLKTVLTALPDDADEGIWQERLDKISGSLGRMGAVNLAAVEELTAQSQRKQHLDAQNDDLVAALETLEGAIRKIDKQTRARFKATFEQVNGDLQALFPKVFGGGAAYLALTDDDLLETGVTVMARPPGKKNSTIHLLSGGEKALTALSLVFAIFRLNPAPFCLLDEVDAPLDDANVGRFCKLVSEMSKSVQFIYITHNKIAMEMAKHLTGVTMAEPGVSRIVAVDVAEAVAIVNV